MKEALVNAGPTVRIVDSPIPVPGSDQVVIKVVVSGSNPKDWKYPALKKEESNQGDDIAGVVHAVGSNVVEFREGDRVAAFHQMMTPGGSYAEYAVAWSHTTFHIPKKTSFEGNVLFHGAKSFGSLTNTTRSRNCSSSSNDSGYRSLPTSVASLTLASCHYSPSTHYLRGSFGRGLFRDPDGRPVEPTSFNMRSWKRHCPCGKVD